MMAGRENGMSRPATKSDLDDMVRTLSWRFGIMIAFVVVAAAFALFAAVTR
jgi:hypothetical protein